MRRLLRAEERDDDERRLPCSITSADAPDAHVLQEQHGWAFEEYAARVPRLLPALPAVSPLLGAALNSLSSWAAAAALELKAGAPK
jgi:hypothetical protein